MIRAIILYIFVIFCASFLGYQIADIAGLIIGILIPGSIFLIVEKMDNKDKGKGMKK